MAVLQLSHSYYRNLSPFFYIFECCYMCDTRQKKNQCESSHWKQLNSIFIEHTMLCLNKFDFDCHFLFTFSPFSMFFFYLFSYAACAAFHLIDFPSSMCYSLFLLFDAVYIWLHSSIFFMNWYGCCKCDFKYNDNENSIEKNSMYEIVMHHNQ